MSESVFRSSPNAFADDSETTHSGLTIGCLSPFSGPAIDERALVSGGHLAGAALDVFENEPLPLHSPLRQLDNVSLSPHVAGGTEQARARLLEMTGANIQRFLPVSDHGTW